MNILLLAVKTDRLPAGIGKADNKLSLTAALTNGYSSLLDRTSPRSDVQASRLLTVFAYREAEIKLPALDLRDPCKSQSTNPKFV